MPGVPLSLVQCGRLWEPVAGMGGSTEPANGEAFKLW